MPSVEVDAMACPFRVSLEADRPNSLRGDLGAAPVMALDREPANARTAVDAIHDRAEVKADLGPGSLPLRLYRHRTPRTWADLACVGPCRRASAIRSGEVGRKDPAPNRLAVSHLPVSSCRLEGRSLAPLYHTIMLTVR